MSYISKIIERANIQAFRHYLLHGDRIESKEFESKEKRIENAYHSCLTMIEKHDADGENSELYAEIMKCITTYEEVYTEIGFQAGILFANSILRQTDTSQLLQHKEFLSIKTADKNYQKPPELNAYFSDGMASRLNLQSIGYYLKEGSNQTEPNKSSFTDRNDQAEFELELGLKKELDKETIKKLLPFILNYACTKEEIQFSIGMKTGAKLALLLTDNNDFDY